MNKLQFSVLASGSDGNAVAVFPGNGPGFLLDCGLTRNALYRRLAMINKSPGDIKWAFVTHKHKDHCNELCGIKLIFDTHSHGYSFDLSHGTEIFSFGLNHDVDCFGFRVECNGINIAYVTDTAYVPEESLRYLLNLDALIIEANYRGKLLAESLDQHGSPASRHLSNEQVACIISAISSRWLKHVVLTHLSRRFNTPAFAFNAGSCGAPQARITVSEQNIPTKMITVLR